MNTDALRAAAEAAEKDAPGKWETGSDDPTGLHFAGACFTDEVFGTETFDRYRVLAACDNTVLARFIAAASPAVVLALLAALDDARAAQERAEGERATVEEVLAGERAAFVYAQTTEAALKRLEGDHRELREWAEWAQDKMAALTAERDRLKKAVEATAAGAAYYAGLGVSEWRAFVPKEVADLFGLA